MGSFLEESGGQASQALRALAVRRTWPAGVALFHEGDPADRVFVLTAGLVKAVALASDGTESILALRGPGEILGELAAVDGGTRSASAVAIEPVEALVVGLEQFRTFLAEHPPAAMALLSVIAGRVRDAGRRQVEFGSTDTAVRLARLIAELADQYGEPTDGGVRVRLVSQEELASLCGASRDSIARALRRLRDEGLVTTARRTVLVGDVASLRAWGQETS